MGGSSRGRRTRRGSVNLPVLCALLIVGCATRPSGSVTTETVGAVSEANLSEAVDDRDVSRVRDLVEQKVDLDEPVILGSTPLMRAANRDYPEIAEVLIEGGADVDASGMDGLAPVHLAARSDSVETLRVLLTAGADPTARSRSGMNALDHAAHAGALEALELLADRGGLDIDESSGVVTQGHGYPRDEGPTPLAIAVRAGELEATKALLAEGADVDQPSTAGQTPLLVAVFSGQSVAMVEVLLGAGADREVRVGCEHGCSLPDGQAALTAEEWAARLGRTQLMELLAST